ncbi:hypothetical protein [Enterocloster clostridioformis]|uniref:hypothetical protein n=1 Tax=Enterocloster clostridioformis TaxID=1531 RepID=UPI0022E4354E|nr:hypothetical protein [Enterocloster clostridioformis]
MGYEDIKDKGFDKRTTSELLEIASKGGKASGEARRRKANLRQTMNAILTSEVDIPEWTPILEALGLDSTLETVISAAMVREAMNGNVKAYTAIKDVLGQTSKSETDLEEQRVRMAAAKARMGVDDEEEQEDDGFLDALKSTVEDDWTDDEMEEGWSDEEEGETAGI